MKKLSTKMIVTLALLVAIEIVLSRFLSINAWNLKIGFNFVPIAFAAVLYGPIWAGVVGGLGDFLGAILFPIGAYFPGFTLTSFLMGVVLGIFLYKNRTLPKIIIAVCINQLILSLLLNSLWISILYNSPYGPLLLTRIVQCAILLPVQIVCIFALEKIMKRVIKEVRLSDDIQGSY